MLQDDRKSQAPQTYWRHVKSLIYNEKIVSKLTQLQLKSWYHFLIYFFNKFSDSLIWKIYDNIEQTLHTYDVAFWRIQGYCKNWKMNALKQAEVSLFFKSWVYTNLALQIHAQEMLMIDDADEKALTHLIINESIRQHFYSKFSSENFTEIFTWLHKYLDIKWSTVLEVAYMKSNSVKIL